MDDSNITNCNSNIPPPIPPRNNVAPANFQNSQSYGGIPGVPYRNPQSPWSPYHQQYGTSSGYYNNTLSSSYGYGYSSAGSNLSSLIPIPARGPFETVESVVHAVSSISMLLDSTYNALVASVRSVFAVGEQLGRMRNQFHQLYAAIAFKRFLIWFRTHFGWIIGYKTTTPDLIWTNVIKDSEKGSKRPSPWPLLMYFGFFLGIPYITWKLSQHSDDSNDSTNNATQNSQNWKTGVGEHYVAKATFDFQSNQNGELNFKTGDMLNVAPKHLQPQGRGWLLASINDDGNTTTGLVPANRIKILGLKVPNTENDDSMNSF